MADYVERNSLRDAELATGVAYEAVRKFVKRETEHPNPRSVRGFTRLFWRERGLVFVAESGEEAPVLWASELRAIFPKGREQALADVGTLFELAGRHPDELPASSPDVKRWLTRLIEAEYRNELPYRKPRRRGGRGKGKPDGE